MWTKNFATVSHLFSFSDDLWSFQFSGDVAPAVVVVAVVIAAAVVVAVFVVVVIAAAVVETVREVLDSSRTLHSMMFH